MDARALLRATSQQRRPGIQDRFASYHPTTHALRCTACAYLPIKHESLWSSHAASKSHRQNVARVLAEEQAQQQHERADGSASGSRGKRKMDDGGVGEDEDGEGDSKGAHASSMSPSAKTIQDATTGTRPESKRPRLGDESQEHDSLGAPSASRAVVDDDEWARFEREVLEAPDQDEPGQGEGRQPDDFDIHAAATISAEPVLLLPQADDDGEAAAAMDTDAAPDGQPHDQQSGMTEEERLAAREREEREEILMRFEEEQRIQDEAEERVHALKNRLQALKAARAARSEASSGTGAGASAGAAGPKKRTGAAGAGADAGGALAKALSKARGKGTLPPKR